MSRYHSYINTSVSILTAYKGEEPFAGYLKRFFAANKKYGSKDRKQISHLCYCFFRTGKLFPDLSVEEKVLAGLFLCSQEQNEILPSLKPAWNKEVSLPIKEKIIFIDKNSSVNNIFPWTEECSEDLSTDLFSKSFLIQPDFFLRIRPGKEREVKMKLKKAEIDFASVNNSCLSLQSAIKVDDLLTIDKEAVIQDYSSQRVAEFFPLNIDNTVKHVWDCCAASGGKSILAKDVLGDIQLTVSDVRENILFNLRKRFGTAGIDKFQSFIADLTEPKVSIPNGPFDLIIADVPCTGSGTWSRTPEQLYFFDAEKIKVYSKLQRNILDNVVKYMKPGGFLLYITCSVFRKENEDQVNYLSEVHNLKLIKSELLKGYEMKADSMFAALLQKLL